MVVLGVYGYETELAKILSLGICGFVVPKLSLELAFLRRILCCSLVVFHHTNSFYKAEFAPHRAILDKRFRWILNTIRQTLRWFTVTCCIHMELFYSVIQDPTDSLSDMPLEVIQDPSHYPSFGSYTSVQLVYKSCSVIFIN